MATDPQNSFRHQYQTLVASGAIEADPAQADAAEDEAASRIIRDTKRAIKDGREILLPRGVADRLIAGDNPVLVIRKWRNVSRADLASAAKISRENLAGIEHGRQSMTTVLQKRLARVLKVPPDVLLD